MANRLYYKQFVIGKNYKRAIFARPGYGHSVNMQSIFQQVYWFCPARNLRNCMPKWGKATKQRSKLVKEIRAFWANKWCVETVPEIKKALLKTTPLPEDIVEILPEYFEYPYEIKRF